MVRKLRSPRYWWVMVVISAGLAAASGWQERWRFALLYLVLGGLGAWLALRSRRPPIDGPPPDQPSHGGPA